MSPFANSVLAACALGALALPPATRAGQSPGSDSIHEQYLQDRAACLSGKSGEDQKTCLREAGAAQQAAKRGQLAVEGAADYERNRFARCEVHKDPAERDYCERRMRGEGTTSGSVAGGGILRELVVTVPADTPQ